VRACAGASGDAPEAAGPGAALLLSGGRAVYAWPPALELAPGARLEWPLWVHPRAPGALDVSLALCYEPAQASPEGMKFRCAARALACHNLREPALRWSSTCGAPLAPPDGGRKRAQSALALNCEPMRAELDAVRLAGLGCAHTL